MDPKLIIQATLFTSPSPVKLKDLAKQLEESVEVVQDLAEELMQEMNQETSALHLVLHDGRLEMVTNPVLAPYLPDRKKGPLTADLSQPQLEALSIVAYKGPVSKAEIEHIRGINCTVILRNLLIRGLVEEVKEGSDLFPKYQLTHEALAYMGLHKLSDLPNYEEHSTHKKLTELIDALDEYAE